MTSLKRTARIAGVLYLLLAFIGPVGLIVIPNTLIAPGDPAATAANIAASRGLFRLGMAAETLIFLIEIALSILLYDLLRPVNKSLALMMASARLAMAAVQGVNLFNQFAVLALVGGADTLAAFDPGQLNALVTFFLGLHSAGALIWGAFFGLHLALLGYLVTRSDFFPRILGILLMAGSLGYLAQSFGVMLLPNLAGTLDLLVAVLSVPGEIGFTLWLLIKGVREGREPAPAV
jgi:hypothetical protein